MKQAHPNRLFRGVASPVLLIIAWELIGRTLAGSGRIPYPTLILNRAVSLSLSGELPLALGYSLARVLTGVLVAATIAAAVAICTICLPRTGRRLEQIVELFRPIPAIALLPLAILWFGPGTPAAIFVVSYAAFFPLVTNAIAGIRSVDRGLVAAARTMGLSTPAVLRFVVLPASMPRLMTGVRVGLGTAWLSIIAAELAVGSISGSGGVGGLGQMMFIFYAFSTDLRGIIVCMITVGLSGLTIDLSLRGLWGWLAPWERTR